MGHPEKATFVGEPSMAGQHLRVLAGYRLAGGLYKYARHEQEMKPNIDNLVLQAKPSARAFFLR
jgi:hypothetical protein